MATEITTLRGNSVCPILVSEVLPNGAVVIAIKHVGSPSHREWYVLAAWQKADFMKGRELVSRPEYITWNLDPDNLACDIGHYNGDLVDAVTDFMNRGFDQ
jgi:hypothetical protein